MPITYCIVCNITKEKYYGSTIRTLQQRLSKHKCKSNRCCSKQIILRGDYDIYQIAEYDTIEEAEMKEKWYIRNKECINKQRVRLTEEERKQYEKEYNKKWNEENSEKKKLINKEYYEKNSEVKIQYQKQYREKNSEKIKEYHEKNKEQINEKNKEKVNCEFCKKQMNRSSIKRHLKLLHFN